MQEKVNSDVKEAHELISEDIERQHGLASETISTAWKIAKAKDFAIGALVVGIVATAIGMAYLNYKNDRDWRDLFSSYDYVLQDGTGNAGNQDESGYGETDTE